MKLKKLLSFLKIFVTILLYPSLLLMNEYIYLTSRVVVKGEETYETTFD